MKGIINGILLIAMTVVLIVVGASSFGIIGGIVGFALGVVIIFVIKRPTVYFLIGQNKYTGGDHPGAYSWMKKAYDTTKLAPRFTLMYAYMMIRDGMLKEAEVILNKVTYLNKRELTREDVMTANLNKAIIMWKQDRLGEAISLLEEIYNSGLKSTTLYGTLGYFYILNNETEKAMKFNLEGYEYNCDNMIIEDNLGLSYILSSEFEKADEIYKKLFEQNPEFIEPYYNYGTLMEKRGRYDEAKKYYEKALEYPEKYLSTVKHEDVEAAIENMSIFSADEIGKPSENDTQEGDEE